MTAKEKVYREGAKNAKKVKGLMLDLKTFAAFAP